MLSKRVETVYIFIEVLVEKIFNIDNGEDALY